MIMIFMKLSTNTGSNLVEGFRPWGGANNYGHSENVKKYFTIIEDKLKATL